MIEKILAEVKVAQTLDNRGSDCASGFVKLLDAMDDLLPGKVLQVLSTDRASQRELRDWAARSGNMLLESSSRGPLWAREYHYLIRKT